MLLAPSPSKCEPRESVFVNPGGFSMLVGSGMAVAPAARSPTVGAAGEFLSVALGLWPWYCVGVWGGSGFWV